MEWTDKLVLDFAIIAQRGAYGEYEGLHKIEDKLKKFKKLNRPPGAAYYWADGNDVIMSTDDGYDSCVDQYKSHEAAEKAAERWQEKENKGVLRAIKKGIPLKDI